MAAPTPRLKIDEFEVHLVYGFVADIIDGEGFGRWFDGRLADATRTGVRERSGWTPMYRLPGGADTVLQRGLPGREGDRLTITPPRDWESAESRSIEAELAFSYAIKRGGAGALTICLACRGESAGKYDTSHILAALLLAPRTEYGLPDEAKSGVFDWQRELSRAALMGGGTLDGVLVEPLDDEALSMRLTLPDLAVSEAHFSPAFKLFLIGMKRLVDYVRPDVTPGEPLLGPLLAWREFGEPERRATETDPLSEDQERYLKPRLYTGATHDPQVPYMYVVGTVPNDIYYESFAERAELGVDYAATRRLRSRFTKDIAAILNRWLLDRNIPYASCDQLEREGMTVDGAFLSHYMNSLLFTAFSGIAALTLKPAEEEQEAASGLSAKRLPFEPAKHSILHFVEFSRMRWHQGISINRDLDLLIDQARDAKGREVQTALANLLDLRLKVAKYMQNPITYRWDATVGTAVARYLHEQVIGELESATTRKLALIKEVLMDRLDLLQSEAVFMQIEYSKSQRRQCDNSDE